MTRSEVIEIQSSINRNFGEINTESPQKKRRQDSMLVCAMLCTLDALVGGYDRNDCIDTAMEWLRVAMEVQ